MLSGIESGVLSMGGGCLWCFSPEEESVSPFSEINQNRRIGAQDYSHAPFQEPYVRLSAHTARAFHYPIMGGNAKRLI